MFCPNDVQMEAWKSSVSQWNTLKCCLTSTPEVLSGPFCSGAMRKYYGGHKQILAQAEAAQGTSALASVLVSEWSWGRVPTELVQRLAEAALQDMDVVLPGGRTNHRVFRELQTLAGLGAQGTQVGNLHRDLLNQLAPTQWPDPYVVRVPMRQGNKRKMQDLPILLPHEVFANLYTYYHSTWVTSICPGEEEADNFWISQQANPQFEHHPLFVDGPPKKTIPLALHGDGIPTTAIGKSWGKSADIISWNSLLASRGLKTVQCNYLLWMLYSNLYVKMVGVDTTREIWRAVAWSFSCLQQGTWPHQDHKGVAFPHGSAAAQMAGSPLAGGWRAILVALRGDLDWFQKMFRLVRPNSSQPCCFCPCSTLNEQLPWTDFRQQAAWRSRQYRVTQELAHVLFRDLPDVNLFTVKVDFMHTKHLGIDAYLCGGVLMLLCYYILPDTPAENLEHIFVQAKELEKHPSMFGALTLGMFCDKDKPHSQYPKLKGKAAEIKAFLRPLKLLWQSCSDQAQVVHLQVQLALQASVRLDEIADGHSEAHTLVGNELHDFRSALSQLLLCFNAIVKHYEDEGLKVFNLTIKCHFMAHLESQVQWLHPRHSWCYSGVDFARHLRDLTKICTPGLGPMAVPTKVLSRYTLAMHTAMCPNKLFKV